MSNRRKHTTKIRRTKKRVASIALPPISREFSEYRGNENRRQRQLADIDGQIDNVAQAVVRWLLDNPSAKEQPSFLALQERLAELEKIIARLVQRKSLSTDDQQWSATVAEVRSLLEKAGQSDVVIAGLPKELADLETELRPKVTKSRIRENLHRLCKESGWTAYRLHKETGVDKKLVLGHMSGKGCSLSTRKRYADALTKKLGRQISPDLES